VRPQLFTVLLAGINAALAYAIVADGFGGPNLDEQVKAASAGQSGLDVPDLLPALAPTAFDALQSEAVFYKSRTYYVAPASPAEQLPPPNYRLAGLMAVPNRPISAVLLDNQSNARVRVAIGDQIDGWMVADVSAKRVLLQLGERTEEITPAMRAAVSGPPGVVRAPSTSEAVPSGPSRPHASTQVDASSRMYRPPSR
jgi:hypothetical protein